MNTKIIKCVNSNNDRSSDNCRFTWDYKSKKENLFSSENMKIREFCYLNLIF